MEEKEMKEVKQISNNTKLLIVDKANKTSSKDDKQPMIAEKEPGRVIITNQEGIFELLFDKDEISWQSIILELVRTNQMNPWDVDVSLLSQK